MLNLYNGTVVTNNRKLQFLLETKLSTDEKVPKTGRVLRNKIFVIGFPPNCTEMDLEKFFSNFGLVRETRIVKDENGITKGYAFITFVKERSVVHALEYRVSFHQGPLYFMDRKLSINPAVKKQHQFIQTERSLSSSSKSIDTPSDMSNSSDNINDLRSLGNTSSFPTLFVPIPSPSNESTIHHYYNTTSQPYYHVNYPSHPTYCTSTHAPVWHQYFSATTSYPPCPYLPMTHNGNCGFPVLSQMNGNVYHNSMLRYTHFPSNDKLFQ